MILNLVTAVPLRKMLELQANLQGEWKVEYKRSITDSIHELELTPVRDDICLSIEALLELGLSPWDIRICEYGKIDE